MLYDLWRQTVAAQTHETALLDLASGQRWSFKQLGELGESSPGDPSPVAFPRGRDLSFFLTILRAWRNGQPVCPLETGQEPAIQSLPPDSVHIKVTSGTTGKGKMILFTANQLWADTANITATMGLSPSSPNFGVISLAHSYGFSNLVLPLFLKGIPLVLAGSSLPETIRSASASFQNLTLPAVPALWRAWEETQAIPGHLRLGISAGAPLSSALEERIFRKWGLKVHNFYGASECGGIAYDRTEIPRQDPAFVGTPLAGVDVRVNQDRCLVVQSRAVGQTYWPEPSDRLSNGAFFTSDLAEIQNDAIFLRGRVNDQINIAGRKASPELIEAALLRHAHVRECVVFGIPSPQADAAETIVACVALDTPLAPETLRQFLLQQLPAWQVPREWMLLDTLETNPRGKISRAEWREKFLASRPHA